MSSVLPDLSGKQCIQALEKAGFVLVRQRGSHVSMRRLQPYAQVVVPLHKEMDRGTIRAIIRQAGMTVDEFISYL